jgi:hypothetical protein
MELLVFAGALVVLDVAAHFFGYDSRDERALDHRTLKDVWPGF